MGQSSKSEPPEALSQISQEKLMKLIKQYGGWLFMAICLAVASTAHNGWANTLAFVPMLGTVFYESPNTGTSLETMAPDDVRTLWQAGVDVFEQSTDFFDEFEGSGAMSLIDTVTDTSKGKGQKMRFTVMSGFYDEPHLGEQLFETSDDYEEILIDGHDLEVDWVRHAYRYTERMEEVMGMRGEIVSGTNVELGKWFGRYKTELMLMMFREKLPSSNVSYAGATSQDTMVSSNTLAWDPIVSLGYIMKRLGGAPAKVGSSKNGKPIFKNVVIAPSDALASLETDPSFRQLLRETRDEDAAALLFNGGWANIRGHMIVEYTPIDHDGEGAIGSPLNAKAFLGNAIAAGTTAIDITGGGNPTSAAKTKKKYFKYFPGYAYPFLLSDVVAVDSSTKYVLIVNPPDAAVDPNKIGMYAYTTGNNGNKITITARLGSAASGVRATTVGNVTWNTGVWAANANGFAGHTDVHPAGALILPCNANGQPFGDILMLGARAARRGYGKYRNKRMSDEHEGGFIQENYIVSVLGQDLRQDRLDRVPGASRMRVAINYPGVPTPVIV